MHEVKQYIRKIVDDGSIEEMHKLSDILDELVCIVKEYDEDLYDKYKMELYIMANGKILTDDMKRQWVKEMKPMSKWSEEEVESIVFQQGIEIPYMSVFVILNMLYSDMESAFGDGNDEESLNRYLQGTNDWYFDEDAKVNGEEKLFNYKMYIVK